MACDADGDVVRDDADWMKPADDRILETFRDLGNLTPLALSKEGEQSRLDIGRKYAGMRCRELAEHGLLERLDKGLYKLTDLGEAYLDEQPIFDECEE